MGRCTGNGSDALCFQASNSKEENPTDLRQTSQAGCPKPRASHRFPNFRNQAGIGPTKINLGPKYLLLSLFSSCVGRKINTSWGHFTCCPLGSSLRVPSWTSSSQKRAKAAGTTSSPLKTYHFWISQSPVSSLTWANNSNHGAATKTE